MDCTVGFGGHAESIIQNLDSKGLLIGLDLDPYALDETKKRLSQFSENISLHNCSYSVFPQILEKLGINEVDGFLFDFGISSFQIDTAHRGFSYMKNAPLDMRFNNNDPDSKTAQDIINTISKDELSHALKVYGDLREHLKISNSIIKSRDTKRMSTTFDLKNAICEVLPYENYSKLSIVFQVIRILVNDEINTIKSTLKQTVDYLRTGGRIAAISFHSIEDRIVKHFFKDQTIYKNSSYDIEYKDSNSKIKVITKKPVVESSKKIHENPRSRSAKLRVAERLA